jgi:hypothetical protein
MPMRNILAGLSSGIMIVYAAYRALITITILPLAGSLWSPSGMYFLSLALAAAGIIALSFTRHVGIAAALGCVLGFVALGYWWVVVCRASHPIWTDFGWFVVPEACFSVAAISKWVSCRRRICGVRV